jgi:hypothetical protein
MGMAEPEEITSSRGKTALGLIGCLTFVAISVVAERAGDTDWTLRAGGIFFGLCTIAFVAMLLRPHRLKLDPEGFILSGGLTRTVKKIGWLNVDDFHVRRFSHGTKMVAFKYAEGAVVPFGGMFGKKGVIPGVWPDGPEVLAERLNAYRHSALNARS